MNKKEIVNQAVRQLGRSKRRRVGRPSPKLDPATRLGKLLTKVGSFARIGQLCDPPLSRSFVSRWPELYHGEVPAQYVPGLVRGLRAAGYKVRIKELIDV